MRGRLTPMMGRKGRARRKGAVLVAIVVVVAGQWVGECM